MPKQKLLIVARRWFESTYGNTYFTAIAYLDGEVMARIPMSYGYGDHYRDAVLSKLVRDQAIPSPLLRDNGRNAEAWEEYSERTGIEISTDVSDVKRKRDLHDWK